MASVSENFVEVVLGVAWTPAAAVIPVLALGAPIATLGAINQTIVGALGRGGTFFTVSAVGAVLRVGALLGAVNFGLVAVALAGVVVEALLAVVSTRLAFPLFGQSVRAVAMGVARPAVASLAMGALVYGLQEALTASAWVELAAAIVTGVTSYTILILAVDRTQARNILRLFSRAAP